MYLTIARSGHNGLYLGALDAYLHSLHPRYTFLPMSGRECDIVYQTPTGVSYDKSFYGIKSKVKNILDPEGMRCITDKRQLYEGYTSLHAERYLPLTRLLSEVNDISPGEVKIVKPIGSRTGAGRGNVVVDSNLSLQEAKRQLLHLGFEEGILSNYITNPLLHDGYKTHFRMFLMIRPRTSTTESSIELWKYGLIRRAREKYVNGDYHDPNIHDTHTSSSAIDLFFPDDCPLVDGDVTFPQRIFALMEEAVAPIKKIVEWKARPPRESKLAFEVYGLDFIVTDVQYPRVFLLEVNTKVSYRPAERYESFNDTSPPEYWSDKYKSFSYEYFKWIFEKGYLPLMNTPEYGQRKNTYMITGGTGLYHSPLMEMLESRGYTPIAPSSRIAYITFNYMEKLSEDLSHYDPIARKVKCRIKSLVNTKKECVTDKQHLSRNLSGTNFIARTYYDENEVPDEEKDKPLIIKPVGDIADSGYGIRVTSSRSEFDDAVISIKNLLGHSNGKLKSYIISRYVDDVDTFKSMVLPVMRSL